MSRSSELFNKAYGSAIVEDDDADFEALDTVAIAIENIVDSAGDNIPTDIQDWIESKLAEVDPDGELSVYEAVLELDLEDAQAFYTSIKSKLDDAGVSYSEENVEM